jgi:hypothetical protein
MELSDAVREALETQVLDHEPGRAALVVRNAVEALGPPDVAGGLLDAAAIALRMMVAETDEAYDQAELVQRLAMDGAVPADSLDVLGSMLVLAASTAGGIRPAVDAVIADVGAERALFGAWLTVLAVVRVVAMSLERTEADIVDEVTASLAAF